MIKFKLLRLVAKIKQHYSEKKNEKLYNNSNKLQKLTIDIILKLLKNKNSTLSIAPLSGERYVYLHDSIYKLNLPETFVAIEYDKILIINHHYHYILEINTLIYHFLAYEFDREAERRRRHLKNDITKNITSSLEHIKQKLQ
jgi:hypothetical protein